VNWWNWEWGTEEVSKEELEKLVELGVEAEEVEAEELVELGGTEEEVGREELEKLWNWE
jgi:hypothetical protein